jgi:soluble lytic murein transglycosylase-like protein
MLPLIPVAIFSVTGYGVWRYFNPLDAQSAESAISTTVSEAVQSITDLFPKAAPYQDAIQGAQNKYGIPDNYLAKLLHAESSYDPAIISGQRKSSAGAVGIAQFMPATAAELGVNPTDPMSAIDGAGKYLSQLYDQFGTWPEAIAAYNWGSGNVAKKGLSKAPTETVNYVQKIAGVDIRNIGG